LKTFLAYARKPAGRVARVQGMGMGMIPGASMVGAQQATDGADSSNSNSDNGDVDDDDDNAADKTTIAPDNDEFSGFVFKLQANLDPRHRDRMAFIRVCSGTFRKGMKVSHSRMKKSINLSSAQSLFAQDRESITEAYPGDVIGIHNPGHFAIGDTIYTGNKRITYPGIPSFSPERFAYLRNPNPGLYKKFQKGLSELLDEGAVQMLRDRGDDGNGTPILAAVGQLQFEVVEYRLKAEYGVDSRMESLGYTMARWVEGGWDAIDKADADGKVRTHGNVFLFWCCCSVLSNLLVSPLLVVHTHTALRRVRGQGPVGAASAALQKPLESDAVGGRGRVPENGPLGVTTVRDHVIDCRQLSRSAEKRTC
jgi:hypothetical protein